MHKDTYKSISKIAWGFIFFLIHIRLGTIDFLPDFVGFIFMLTAINELKDESKTINQLKPFGTILTIWYFAVWVLNIFAAGTVWLSYINLLAVIINIYFTFRLLTECSMIAKKYQPETDSLDKKIIRNRNIYTVTITLCNIISTLTYILTGYDNEAVAMVSLALGLVALIIMFMTVSSLFSLSKIIKEAPDKTDTQELYEYTIEQPDSITEAEESTEKSDE